MRMLVLVLVLVLLETSFLMAAQVGKAFPPIHIKLNRNSDGGMIRYLMNNLRPNQKLIDSM